MTGAFVALAGALRKLRPITVGANWGSSSGSAPITSSAQTLTVPAGNPGTIQFAVSGTSSFYYKKNAGSFTAITDGATLSVANGDTLQFRFDALSSFGDLSVTDYTTGAAVGTWSAVTS